MLHLITVHADLVATNNRLKPVVLAEPLGDIRSKLHADTALAGTTTGLLLGIGPQHLHHQTGLTGLALSVPVEFADVVQRDLVVREQTTVQHQVLGSDQGGEGEGGETLREELEDPALVSFLYQDYDA